MNLDAINLPEGVGNLTFGMTKSDIVKLLGDNFKERIETDGDLELEYEHLSIRCTFLKEFDYRLGVITTERKKATLCGEILFGKSKSQLRRFIREKLKGDISEEDGCIHEDGHIQEWIDVSEKNILFWFRNDELYLIDCFCSWADDDTPIWHESEA